MFYENNALKNGGDFIQSKQETHGQNCTWELVQYPTMDLERLRHDLTATEDNLVKKRQYFRQTRQQLIAQWRDLAAKEQQLRDSFIKFNFFIRENCEKRSRAVENIEANKKFIVGKLTEIHTLIEKIQLLKQSKILMDSNIRTHRIYENYLSDVVASDDSFKGVNDLLERYESYAKARHVLGENQQKCLEQLEKAYGEMKKLNEKFRLILVGLHNQISSLQERYDNSAMKSRKWETVVGQIYQYMNGKFNEIEMVKCSIWNTYKHMCQKKQVLVTCPRADFEHQLFFIKKTIREIGDIKKMIQGGK